MRTTLSSSVGPVDLGASMTPKIDVTSTIRARAVLGPANSVLNEFLRTQEEEEALLSGKPPRKAKAGEFERQPNSGSRWTTEPDFLSPSPIVDRPRLADGRMSFYFDYKTISKRVAITWHGSSIHPHFDAPREPAVRHAKYIERGGAAELGRAIAHDHYIVRDDAVETSPGPEGELYVRSIFSNISEDPWERAEYWRLIEELETSPNLHHIYFNPDCSPGWWQALEERDIDPPVLREYGLAVLTAYREHIAAGKDEDDFKSEPLVLAIEPEKLKKKARDRIGSVPLGYFLSRAVNGLPDYDDRAPPIRVEPVRSGRIQFRMIAELPHEVTASDRAEITQRFCHHLATLETRTNDDGTTTTVGMMYTASVHAPDHHNDPRNYHLHVVAHDWPAEQDETGEWDFARAKHSTDDKGRSSTTFPDRQDKISVVSQNTTISGDENSGNRFIMSLRKKIASICNEVLIRRGISKRYDHRRYDEMEIIREPTLHLNSAAAALESVAVSTFPGRQNAAKIWDGEKQEIIRRASQRRSELAKQQDGFVSPSIWVADFPEGHAFRAQVEELRDERSRLIDGLADARRDLELFAHHERKAKSSAFRTMRTCERYLQAIMLGSAEPKITRQAELIRTRLEAARRHLNAIDLALQPHRDTLEKLSDEIVARERRLIDLDITWAALKPQVRGEWERIHASRMHTAERAAFQRRLSAERRAGALLTDPVASETRPAALSVEGGADASSPSAVRQAPMTIEGLEIAPATIPPAAPHVPELSPREQAQVEHGAAGSARTASRAETMFPLSAEAGNDAALDGSPVVLEPDTSRVVEVDPEPSEEIAPAQPFTSLQTASAASLVGSLGQPATQPTVPTVTSDEASTSGEVHGSANAAETAGRDVQQDRGAASREIIIEEGQACPPETPTGPLEQPDEPGSAASVPTQPRADHQERNLPGTAPHSGQPGSRSARHGSVDAQANEKPKTPPDTVGKHEDVSHHEDMVSGSAQSSRAGSSVSHRPAAERLRDEIRSRVGQTAVRQSGAPLEAEQASSAAGAGSGPEGSREASASGRSQRGVANPQQAETSPSPPPLKPSAKEKSQDAWDLLMARIWNEKVPVRRHQRADGTVWFDVPSLTAADAAPLRLRKSHHTHERLGKIFKYQQHEIEKGVRWIHQNGRYAERLQIDESGVKIRDRSGQVPAVLKAWENEPEVQQAIRAERDRRDAIDAELASIWRAFGLAQIPSFSERQEETCGALPTPDQMSQPAAFEFVRVLREGALLAELREAAKAVDEQPSARAEILSSSAALQAEFKRLEPSPDPALGRAALGLGGSER